MLCRMFDVGCEVRKADARHINVMPSTPLLHALPRLYLYLHPAAIFHLELSVQLLITAFSSEKIAHAENYAS
mgnify:CR=1 FL=1